MSRITKRRGGSGAKVMQGTGHAGMLDSAVQLLAFHPGNQTETRSIPVRYRSLTNLKCHAGKRATRYGRSSSVSATSLARGEDTFASCDGCWMLLPWLSCEVAFVSELREMIRWGGLQPSPTWHVERRSQMCNRMQQQCAAVKSQAQGEFLHEAQSGRACCARPLRTPIGRPMQSLHWTACIAVEA